MLLLLLFYTILLVYAVFILWLTLSLPKSPNDNSFEISESETSFTVVIPMRNESKNLPQLFQSISELSYPPSLFEIIIVDDDSQDDSWAKIRGFQAQHREIRVVLLSNSAENNLKSTSLSSLTPKKRAIHKAIALSTFKYIVTTDADVILPRCWLIGYDSVMQDTVADLVAGGVVVAKGNSFLSHYQHYDMLSLQWFGFSSYFRKHPVICNGANLCYRKEAYINAEVHAGKESIASGDDVFTLQKFKELGFKIKFMIDADASVWTHALESFGALHQQRKRWAKKSTSVDSLYFKSVGILITVFQSTLVISLMIGFWNFTFLGFLVNAFILKLILDGWSLSRMASLQKLELCWTDFLKVSFVYPFFTLGFALSSLVGTLEWKERTYKK